MKRSPLILVLAVVFIIGGVMLHATTRPGEIPMPDSSASAISYLVASEAGTVTGPQRRDEDSITVYVTRTGEKYHRGTCRYLSRSKIPTTLRDAKRNGYDPCSVCRPPR